MVPFSTLVPFSPLLRKGFETTYRTTQDHAHHCLVTQHGTHQVSAQIRVDSVCRAKIRGRKKLDLAKRNLRYREPGLCILFVFSFSSFKSQNEVLYPHQNTL